MALHLDSGHLTATSSDFFSIYISLNLQINNLARSNLFSVRSRHLGLSEWSDVGRHHNFRLDHAKPKTATLSFNPS